MPKGIKGFQKGHLIRLGVKHSEHTKEKMRQIAKKQKRKVSFLGKHHSEKSKELNRQKHLGISPWNKGINFKQIMGSKNPMWQGGIKKANGYIQVLLPHHHRAQKSGYVKRCILVMEKYIGRPLSLTEVVHHINEITDDDRVENLRLFINESEHQKFHYQSRKLNCKGQFLSKINR